MKYLQIVASIFFIGLFASCENQHKSNTQIYLPLMEWINIYKQGIPNAIEQIKSLGYKFERDFEAGEEQMSVFAYNLTNDGMADIRVFVGHREGRELIRVQFYGNSGTKYYEKLLSEVQTAGQLIEKYTSTSNVPCQAWKAEKIRVNFCEGVENGNTEYIVELLESRE